MSLLALGAYKFGAVVSSAVLNVGGGIRVGGAKDVISTIQEKFFNTVFVLLGYIAKSDGRVNRIEIKLTESYMEKMALTPERRHMAIELFHLGAKPEYNPSALLKEFCKVARPSPNQREIMLVYLINLARMDGVLVDDEMREIHEVAEQLGFSGILFKQLLRMLSAHAEFADSQPSKTQQPKREDIAREDAQPASANGNQGQQGAGQDKRESQYSDADKNGYRRQEESGKGEERSSDRANNAGTKTDALLVAYEVLGILPNATDAEVKKAYRRLVNQYHPDKLVGQGLPDFVLLAMAEHFQVVQAAYELIKQRRAATQAA